MKQIWRTLKNIFRIKLTKKMKRSELNGLKDKELREIKLLKVRTSIKLFHTIQIALTSIKKCFNLMEIGPLPILKRNV